MEVYLIRHTETNCENGVCYGQSDVSLKVPYNEEFLKIKNQLPTEIEVCFSSPLLRCKELADYLYPNSYQTDNRIMEMNFGNWELKKWDDIPKEELNPWMENFVEVKVPNGESFIELNNRVLSFIYYLQSSSYKSVTIISHAGVIRSFLCYIQKLPLKDAFQNKVGYGDVIHVEI